MGQCGDLTSCSKVYIEYFCITLYRLRKEYNIFKHTGNLLYHQEEGKERREKEFNGNFFVQVEFTLIVI